jgi:hypothetical protein
MSTTLPIRKATTRPGGRTARITTRETAGSLRVLVLTVSVLSSPVSARTSLGSFDGWAAFRDERPPRCFAIAEPVRGGGGKWRPYATVSTWPGQRVRGQVHLRLGRALRDGAPVTLVIGNRRFPLVSGGADAWAPDQRSDAAIVAAMRSARTMSVASVAATGGGFVETYVLRGAATAIDAAALGCARG